MIVGIIGSGGREHAICTKLKNSKKVSEIYCFPGNAGTSKIAKNIELNTDDFEKLNTLFLYFASVYSECAIYEFNNILGFCIQYYRL